MFPLPVSHKMPHIFYTKRPVTLRSPSKIYSVPDRVPNVFNNFLSRFRDIWFSKFGSHRKYHALKLYCVKFKNIGQPV